jgi:hypothetical protein
MPASLYDRHKANYLSVSHALTQIERAANDALRRGDSPAAEAFTMTQMLLVAVKAEARLQRLIYTPDWLNDRQRKYVKSASTRFEMWQRIIETGFRQKYGKRKRTVPLEDQLDHSAASRYKTLLEVLGQDLREMIEIRNKLAHGQWVYGLTDDGRISSELTKRLRTTNTLALRFQDSIAGDLANAVGDLLLPGNQFDARFDEHYRKIRSSHESLANIDFPAHVERLKGSKQNIRVTKIPSGSSTD